MMSVCLPVIYHMCSGTYSSHISIITHSTARMCGLIFMRQICHSLIFIQFKAKCPIKDKIVTNTEVENPFTYKETRCGLETNYGA